MVSLSCARCGFVIGSERWVKIGDDAIYHIRCWELERPPLKNRRSNSGGLICPKCERPIREGDGTAFRESYAVHVGCMPEPA